MKQQIILWVMILAMSSGSWSQEKEFPKSWTGNWKGELVDRYRIGSYQKATLTRF